MPLSSRFTPQEDVWLDEYVWNISNSRRQSTVSDTDPGTRADIHTSSYSYNLHSRLSSGSSYCGEHRGSCQCNEDQALRDAAVPHRRLTAPSPTQSSEIGIDNLDLTGLGSQFAELDYRYKVWMDKFFNEPKYSEDSYVVEWYDRESFRGGF